MNGDAVIQILASYGGFGAIVLIMGRWFLAQYEQQQQERLGQAQQMVDLLREQLGRAQTMMADQEAYIRGQDRKNLELSVKVLNVLDSISAEVPGLHQRLDDHDREIKSLHQELTGRVAEIERHLSMRGGGNEQRR